MTKKLTILAVAAGCVLSAHAAEKKIYAHYMGCNPAWGGATRWHYYETHNYLKNTNDYVSAMGGNFRNWPLVPYPAERDAVDELVNAKMEISRAKRFGFDGFAFDAWAGGDECKQRLETFFKAAEEMKVDFGLTICFDRSCHNVPQGTTVVDAYLESANLVLKHKNSPNLARFEGKPLFFGYYSNAIDPATNQGSLEEKFAAEKRGWEEFRKRIGMPVFIHGSMDNYGGDWQKIGQLAAEIYDAVGGFLGGGPDSSGGAVTAEAVRKGGKIWSQPMSFQYANCWGWVIAWTGIDLLRFNWEAAIKNKSRLIQFVTWNDYGEESCIAPTTGHGYSMLRANQYYIDLWKNDGKEPPVEKDEVHVFFRKVRGMPAPFPFYCRQQGAGTWVQVITYLTEPAELSVEGYDEVVTVPKGMHIQTYEPHLGTIKVTLKRKGKKVLFLETPEAISDKRWREDPTVSAYGSTFDEEWKKDFPQVKPEHYSENGDLDGDGLPNWWEMINFGKFPQMQTATVAKPKDDPDHDGLTNLEEYLNDTDPNWPDAPYEKGYVWDSRFAAKKNLSWNPARDDHNKSVWYCYNDRGADDQKPTYDGNWKICPLILNVPTTHNYIGPTWGESVNFNLEKGEISLNGNGNTVMLWAWQSPIDGEVDIAASLRAGGGGGTLHALVLHKSAKDTKKIGDVSMQGDEKKRFAKAKFKVAKGDEIVFEPDYHESQGIGSLIVESVKVRVVSAKGQKGKKGSARK